MLPDGWRDLLLDDVAQRKSGHTPSKENHSYWGGGIRWVSLADSSRLDKGLITETDKHVSEQGLKNSSAVLLPEGTVVLSRDAGVGKSGIISMAMAVSQHFIAWDCTQSKDLQNWYLYHWLQSKKVEFERVANGSAIKTIGLGYFKRLRVMAPPLAEQQKISQLLNCWDSVILATDRLLTNSRKQRLSLLTRLLQTPASSTEVAERDRVGNHPPSVQAGMPRLSPMPRDWQRFKLREVLSEVSRPLSLMPQDRYALVTVKRSRGGVVSRGTLRGKEIKTASQSMVKGGDFLISKRQIVHGACGVVPCSLDGAVVSNEYSVLKSDGRLDLNFLRYLSESIYFQQTCFHSSIGVHVEKMIFNTDRWLNFEFNIPPIEEQRRIVRVLDCSASEIERLQLQIAMLRKEKQALMQQLLTGKRRIQFADAAVKVRKTTSAKASVKTRVGKTPTTRTPIAKDKRP